jgi:hypothetical protein
MRNKLFPHFQILKETSTNDCETSINDLNVDNMFSRLVWHWVFSGGCEAGGSIKRK